MRDLAALLVHLIATIAQLLRPGGLLSGCRYAYQAHGAGDGDAPINRNWLFDSSQNTCLPDPLTKMPEQEP